MLTTTLIRFPKKGDQHATGFFYNYDEDTYLVTNRHVLEHEHDQPAKIAVWFREHSSVDDTSRVEIPLYANGFPRWLIHPLLPEVDIAVLPINQQLSTLTEEDPVTGSVALSADSFASPDTLIRGGTGARAFGYPSGYVDTNSRFPVARNGMIASPYGNWFDERPQFLVDGVMGQGMSGSPVFTERSVVTEDTSGSSVVQSPSSFFIGVHSGDYRQPNDLRDTDLNLNHVWYAELIELILRINGISEYVETVDFDQSSKQLNEGANVKVSMELLSKATTWNMFDPGKNRPDSPSEDLDEKVAIKNSSEIRSILDDVIEGSDNLDNV